MVDRAFCGNFYFNGKFEYLEVSVSDGKIVSIKKDAGNTDKKYLNGAIFPASTDMHVHFRDPGETEKEDFYTGSMSAIYGGTTLVMDMPNNRFPIVDYMKYEDKLNTVRRKSFADFGLYSMETGNNADIIEPKSSGLKIYLGGSTNSVGIGSINDKELSKIRSFNVPVVFHGEMQSCLERHKIEAANLREYNISRPTECEKEASEYISNLDIVTKVMAHITSPDVSGKFLREVTPHHLLLNDDMPLGPLGKVNPPLREKHVQSALLDSYVAGNFDIVSSDHAPHTEEEKSDFIHAKSGIIGVETRVPLLLMLIKRKILSYDVFYRTAIMNPPDIFGIKKGKIEAGYDADFFSVDFGNEEQLNEYKLHSKVPRSPFNGMHVIFPENVILRGEAVIEKREAIMDPSGRYIPSQKSVSGN
ncbi:MAG: dihydroorotase [Thermoplasmata archaeon]